MVYKTSEKQRKQALEYYYKNRKEVLKVKILCRKCHNNLHHNKV